MIKMHLAARVPNEGARRLAWVICDRFGGDVFAFASAACVMPSTVERLIAGEIAPGDALLLPIMAATRCEVLPLDFRRKPLAWWGVRPAPRGGDQGQGARGRLRQRVRAGEELSPLRASPAPVRVLRPSERGASA